MRVAIVEDEVQAAEILEKYFADYARQEQKQIEVEFFRDPVFFADSYKPAYELILLDIQMPEMNGMKLAQKIRKLDESVFLVFVTSMAQYAIEGYKVSALDYILKPISYFEFSTMLDKVLQRVEESESPSIIVSSKRETHRVNVNRIRYIEIQDHRLFLHMEDEVLEVWGTLTSIAAMLPEKSFSRVNAGQLVNLNAVIGVRDEMVLLPGVKLPLSRRRKKDFCADLAFYFGEKGHV